MKTIFMDVITRGGYNLSGILKKIDVYHVEEKLSDDERNELREYAINNADVAKHPEYAAIAERVKRELGIVPEDETEAVE